MAKFLTLKLACIALLIGTTQGVNPFKKMFGTVIQDVPPHEETGDPVFVTPLLNSGNYTEAQMLSYVNPKALGLKKLIESYSGYFTVGSPSCNSNLFFWYFPAFTSSETAPVLLWLQGGPGGSSLFGLFSEHGPFKVSRDLHSLKFRRETWATSHNIIYIDNPVGTGYSFTSKDECYAQNESDVANDLLDALQQFFTMFPDLRANDFFVSGESYAGKYVPAISYKIHINNKAVRNDEDKMINFKGMAIGDGLCDPESMTDYGNFLYGIGLVDEEDRDYFTKVSKMITDAISNKKWLQAFQLFDNLLNGDLSGRTSYFTNVTGFTNYFNYLLPEMPEMLDRYNSFIQLAHVRRNIHVGNLTFNDGSVVEKHLLNDVMQSVKPWIETLIESNYRVLIYNGQLDVIIPYTSTENFVRSLKWNGADEYLKSVRKIWKVGSDLAGYSKTVGNFTTLLVRNAGHMIPFDQPIWALDMINRFTRGKNF